MGFWESSLATDSVFTFYEDRITINTGYSAKCKYFKLIGDLNVVIGGKLLITDGQFDALNDVQNYGMIRIIGSPEEGLIFSTIRNSESHGMHVMAPPAMLVNRELAEIYIVLSGGSGLLQEGGSIDNIDSAKIFMDRAVLTELHFKRYINLTLDLFSKIVPLLI